MRERVISGVVIALIVVLCGLVGKGYLLGAAMAVCGSIGFWELCKTCGVLTPKADGTIPPEGSADTKTQKSNSLVVLGILLTAVYYAGLLLIQYLNAQDQKTMFHHADLLMLVMMSMGLIAFMAVYVLTFPKYNSDRVMAAYFSFIYAPVMLSFVYRARLLPYGIFVYILIFLCSSVCDVCALAAGMAFGRHKMAPILSPKKTIEGAVGGVIGSMVSCAVVALIVQHFDKGAKLVVPFMILGFVGALVSMLGDLAASAIKRDHNIKDYGNLIPGHGGIMDRLDSTIFAAPLIYFTGVLLLGTAV